MRARVTTIILLLGHLFAQALLLLSEFESELGAEVFGFEYLADFNLGVFVMRGLGSA
jgi:hypothetical protein